MPAIDAEELANSAEHQTPDPPTLSGPIIGIIYPPPEVRSILNLKILYHCASKTVVFCVAKRHSFKTFNNFP